MTTLVIGAGIIGVSIADALAERGASVTVLDMRAPGRGASVASAGILAPYVETHKDPRFLQLATRSLDLFDAFVAGAGGRSGRRVEYARTGTLEVALDEDDLERLKAAKAWLDASGVPNDWLSAAELHTAEPAVARTSPGALLVRQHGFVGVKSLVDALVQSARLAGAIFETPVEAVDVDPRADGIQVRAGERQYAAESVVIAAGTWSGRVRVRGGLRLDVRPIRGQLLQLRWTGGDAPSRVVWGPRCYTVPWSDGSLLVGATMEDVGFDERTTTAAVHELMTAAGELLPGAWRASLDEVRVGLRPASPDGLPIIGPFAAAPRVVVATGHFRNGVLLAPVTAQIVTEYLLDGKTDPAIAFTTPARLDT